MSEENIKTYVDLVSSTRGNIVENIHQGIAVAMDSEGRIIKQWGDITTEIFPRSALKHNDHLQLAEVSMCQHQLLVQYQVHA